MNKIKATTDPVAPTLPGTDILIPPSQDDLPYEDGLPMETNRHRQQIDLLIKTLKIGLGSRSAFVGGNMFIYYSLEQVRNQDFKGPDVFAVLDVSPEDRKSWVIWEEGKGPDVVIELLSDTTRSQDKDDLSPKGKMRIYRERVRVPEYFWFDPYNPEDWAGFRLQGGIYVPIPEQDGRLVSEHLGLSLVKWAGTYETFSGQASSESETIIWLRWARLAGELILTEAEQERQRAEQERQRADRAEERVRELEARLREAGLDP